MISELRGVLLDGDPAPTYTVSPYLREEDQVPAVVYEVSEDEIIDDLSPSGNQFRRSVVDLRCVGATYDAADDVADDVHSKIRGKTWSDTPIDAAHVFEFERTYDMPIESSNQLLYITTVRVQVWWDGSYSG